VRGKVDLFSFGTLIGMAATAGMAPRVTVSRFKASVNNRALNCPFLAA